MTSLNLCSDCILDNLRYKCEKCRKYVTTEDSVSLSDTLLCMDCARSTLTDDMLQEITVNCDLMMSKIIESTNIKWEESYDLYFLEFQRFDDHEQSMQNSWTVNDSGETYKLNFESIKKLIISDKKVVSHERIGVNSRHWKNNELFIVDKTYVVVKYYVMNLIENLNNSEDDDIRDLISKKIVEISRWMLRSFYRFAIPRKNSVRADNFFQYSLAFAKEKLNKNEGVLSLKYMIAKKILREDPETINENIQALFETEQGKELFDIMNREILNFQTDEINPATIEEGQIMWPPYRLVATGVYTEGLPYSTQTLTDQDTLTSTRINTGDDTFEMISAVNKKCNGILISTVKNENTTFVMNENIISTVDNSIPYNIRWSLGDNKLNELLTGGLPAMQLQNKITLWKMNNTLPDEHEDKNLLVEHKRDVNSRLSYNYYMKWRLSDPTEGIIRGVRGLWQEGTYLEKGKCDTEAIQDSYNGQEKYRSSWNRNRCKQINGCEWTTTGCRETGTRGPWSGKKARIDPESWTAKLKGWVSNDDIPESGVNTPFFENNEIGRNYIHDLIMYKLSTVSGIYPDDIHKLTGTNKSYMKAIIRLCKKEKVTEDIITRIKTDGIVSDFQSRVAMVYIERNNFWLENETIFNAVNRIYPPSGDERVVGVVPQDDHEYLNRMRRAGLRPKPQKTKWSHAPRYRPRNKLTDGTDYVPNDSFSSPGVNIYTKNNFTYDPNCRKCEKDNLFNKYGLNEIDVERSEGVSQETSQEVVERAPNATWEKPFETRYRREYDQIPDGWVGYYPEDEYMGELKEDDTITEYMGELKEDDTITEYKGELKEDDTITEYKGDPNDDH